MIYVQMHGRLGNQLFQYAAARSLQEKTGQNITLDFSQVNGANTEGTEGWENSLKYFNIKPVVISNSKNLLSNFNLLTRIVCTVYAVSYRPYMHDFTKWYKYQLKWMPLLDKMGIRWLANGYYNYKNNEAQDFLLNGSFESIEYFADIREKLLQEFVPKEQMICANKELYKRIKEENSVCVSLRHFQLEGQKAKTYEICGKKYYDTAIKVLKERLTNPLFFVFSDDIEWARHALKLEDNVCYEPANTPVWEKMRLMYSCKHFIIPNSTFAWWAQYLGNSKEKIVVGPTKWFNNNYRSPLIDNAWILIDYNGNVSNSTI